MVTHRATTSKSGTGNSPGGRPTSTHVPRLRVMPMPCVKVPSDGAVMSTPCAPPSVALITAATGSSLVAAFTTAAAPRRVACASLASSTSTAHTLRPIAVAY